MQFRLKRQEKEKGNIKSVSKKLAQNAIVIISAVCASFLKQTLDGKTIFSGATKFDSNEATVDEIGSLEGQWKKN